MIRSFARSIRKPVLWLMLPLAVLAGRPNAGCVCVDGSVKTACCQSTWLLANFAPNSAEGSDCCTARHAGACRSCGSSADEEHTDNGVSGCSSPGACQCHALANNVKPTKITDWSAADGFTHALAPAAVFAAQPQVHSASFQSSPGDASHPLDLVVLYQRLTI